MNDVYCILYSEVYLISICIQLKYYIMIYRVLSYTANMKRKKKYQKQINVYEIECGNELVDTFKTDN